MKIVLIPPYKTTSDVMWPPSWGLHELVDNMKQRHQLEGIEVDIDDGYPFPTKVPMIANDEFLAHITAGVVEKVREYSEMGKHDAIIQTGDLEPGFFGARCVSKIPYISSTHAAIHVASLVGDRFTLFGVTDPTAQILRRMVNSFGFGHKVVSVRHPSFRASYIGSFISKYKKEDRIKVPEVKEIISALGAQFVAAIEEDRVDSLILGCSVLQIFADELRAELNKSGYNEIPIIVSLYAAVEVSKLMVNMTLTQAPRAYPGDALRAKPAFR